MSEKSKEPKIIKEEYVEYSPDILPVDTQNYQDEFLYGKSIERLSTKQIKWSSWWNVFAGNVSYNSTWVKTVSWVWFTPKLVEIHASISNSSSDWYWDWTNIFCRYTIYGGSVTVWTTSAYSAYLSSGWNACITSTITPTSDGFTINVVNVSAWSFTICYKCFW